jgi:hypothetical protein
MKNFFTKIPLVFLSIFSLVPEMNAGLQHAIVGWDYGNGKVLYCGMTYMGSNLYSFGTDLLNSPDNVQLLDNMVNFLSSTPNATIGIFYTLNTLDRCTILRDTLIGRGYNASLVISTDIDTDVEIQNYDVLLLSGSGVSDGESNALYGNVDLTVKAYVETHGGSVLFLGWCVYTFDANVSDYQGYIDLMPVETNASYGYQEEYTLNVTIPSSPIFNGVYNNSSQYYGECPNGNAKTNTTIYAGYKEYIPNNAPVASDVSISGIAGVGNTLTGSYSYSDVDDDIEGTSTFKWYRADDVSGTNTASIGGAATTEYITTSADNEKYIAFEVTPVATSGALTGNPVKSSYLYILSVPSAQASETGAVSITKNTMDIGWTRGNGSKCIVFMKEGNSGNAAPETGTAYTASTVFENGTQIGSSGWYCVYNGTGTGVSVTGLSAATVYQVHVCEYAGGVGSELYNISQSTNNPITGTTLKLDQAITFNSLSDVLFGIADFDLAAVSDLELEIAYSSSDENVAVISGKTVTIAGIGTTKITASQAGNDTVNAAVAVEQTLHVNNKVTITIAACYEYNFNGDVLSLSGEYFDTIPNSAGTDSIITLNLTILKSTVSSITTSSCDSYTSPSGKLWTTTGTYTDTIANAAGCDSIMAIDLTILESTTGSITESVNGSYTSPGGKVWTVTGTYTDTIANSAGCDSIITISLTIITNVSGITDNSSINYYPNPVTNNLNIEFNKQFTGVLKIITEHGVVISKQPVNSTNAFQVNTSELVKGLYIIQLINETDNYILKFIKE